MLISVTQISQYEETTNFPHLTRTHLRCNTSSISVKQEKINYISYYLGYFATSKKHSQFTDLIVHLLSLYRTILLMFLMRP